MDSVLQHQAGRAYVLNVSSMLWT